MQHQVLARKWRPRTFTEMVGQEHVLKALINALDHDRLHHAYLFTGTRGVGKTTIARILAKCLNCEAGVSSQPCNRCASCMEINEGRCVDLIEVDAASRTKVEDTRELLDNVQYAPTRCRFKIYLIDEVHMLSSHSFNALLKTLEEPPPHIKFLLATTDPQKLPVTILSRCLQFNLKNLAPDAIVEHLKEVLNQEQVDFDEAALWQLGRAADGSMRDALSLTDQAIAYGDNSVHEADVGAMPGTIDRGRVYHLMQALLAGDAGQLLNQVAELANYSPNYLSVLDELIAILHRIAVAQAVPELADNSFGDLGKIQEFAGCITAADLQLYYQIALIGRRDLPLNPDLRAGLEMVLLRMIAFQPDRGSAPAKKKGAGKTDSQQAGLRAQTNQETAPAALATARQSVPGRPRSPGPGVGLAAVGESVREVRPKLDLVVNKTPEEQASHRPEPVQAEQPKPIRPAPKPVQPEAGLVPPEAVIDKLAIDQLDDNGTWIGVVAQLAVKGMSKNILMQCTFLSRRDMTLQLQIDPQYFDLLNESHQQRITDALTDYFAGPLNVRIEAGSSELETPMAHQQRKLKERLQQARDALEQDPVVQDIIQRFDASLDLESIEPIE